MNTHGVALKDAVSGREVLDAITKSYDLPLGAIAPYRREHPIFGLLDDDAFMARHGGWRGPYEEGTLFFYIDEYIKDAPKDLLTVLATTCDWLSRRLKKQSALVQKNIDDLAGLLQLNPAERALLIDLTFSAAVLLGVLAGHTEKAEQFQAARKKAFPNAYPWRLHANWGERMRGEGIFAEQIRDLFGVAARRAGDEDAKAEGGKIT